MPKLEKIKLQIPVSCPYCQAELMIYYERKPMKFVSKFYAPCSCGEVAEFTNAELEPIWHKIRRMKK